LKKNLKKFKITTDKAPVRMHTWLFFLFLLLLQKNCLSLTMMTKKPSINRNFSLLSFPLLSNPSKASFCFNCGDGFTNELAKFCPNCGSTREAETTYNPTKAHSERSLKALKVGDLRKVAADLAIPTSGLTKPKLIASIIAAQNIQAVVSKEAPPSSSLSQTLESFVLESWLDIRGQEVSQNTYRCEEGYWISESGGILASLGQILLVDLKPYHFEQHIQAMQNRKCTKRTQQLHRSAYLACMKYLTYVGLIEDVGTIRPIKNKRSEKWEVIPFSANEVSKLLDCATTPMHRALFALGVGQGLRPR